MSAPEPEPVASSDGSTVICHIPPGNPENAHTLTAGAAAVSAHLGHGDSLGACGSPPPPPGTCAGIDARCETTACCPGLACYDAESFDCRPESTSACACVLLE